MENNSVLTEKDFMLHFISIYREMTILWKIKTKEHMDKKKRTVALKKMTNLLRMYRQDITEDEVKKKINILRTSFNRENNKVKRSMLSGSSTDDLYEPSLWYFKELEFLKNQIAGESGISTIMEQQESSSLQSLASTSSQTSEISTAEPPKLQKKKRKQEDLEKELITLPRDYLKNPENECQLIAKSWCFKLERMSAEQRRLAEKFINDILFEGEEGTLHRHSVTIHPICQYSVTSTPSPLSQNHSLYQPTLKQESI